MDRQTYIDVCHTSADFQSYGFDLVQVKHDGQWCAVTVRNGLAEVAGRNGGRLATLAVPGVPDCTLIGEYMGGTERAGRDPMAGGVWVFDCIELSMFLFAPNDYFERYALAASLIGQLHTDRGYPPSLALVENFPLEWTAADTWRKLVVEAGAEGLIYRRSSDTYAGAVIGREKAVQTYDGVCTGAVTEKGLPVFRFGDASQAVRLAECERAGLRAGRVAEFGALARFASGKLRNPLFLGWRDDK